MKTLNSNHPLLTNDQKIIFFTLMMIQMCVLVNLVVFPYFPIIPITIITLITLFISFFYPKLMLILLVISIPASEELNITVGPIVIRLVDILILNLILYNIVNFLFNKNYKIKSLPLFKGVLYAILVCAFLSLTNTISFSKSLLEIIQIIELLITGVLLFNLIEDESYIYTAIISLLVYGIIDSTWIYFQLVTGSLVGRHVGLFQSLAIELSYCSAAAIWLFYCTKRNSIKILLLFLSIYLIGALYLTKGRGAMIIAVIMIFIIGLLYALSRKKVAPFLLTSGLIWIAVVFFFLFLSNTEHQSRYTSIVEGGEFRDLRLIVWAVAFKVWNQFPIFGIGVGNTGIALEQYAPKPFGIALTALTDVKSPHNEYLNFAMQAGYIGLITGIVFYFYLIQSIFKAFIKSINLSDDLLGISIVLLAFVIGLQIWNFANDVLLAGQGMFVMLLIAMISRLYLLQKRAYK